MSSAGASDTTNAMDKIMRFKKEPFPRISVSLNMLETGFDCAEAVNLVMARFTKSAILYQQMLGHPDLEVQQSFRRAVCRLEAQSRCLDAATKKAEIMAAALLTEVFETGSAAAFCHAT